MEPKVKSEEEKKLELIEKRKEEKLKFDQLVRQRQRAIFGERHVGNTLSELKAPPWVAEKIANWMKNPKHFLVYIGNPGCGKTYMCAALTEWAMKQYDFFAYYHEKDLMSKIRDSMDMKGDYLQTLKYMIDYELVMLDDMGSTKLNEFREEIWMDAIDSRYNTMKPTIITSNFTKKEFTEKYHKRLCSRIFSGENTIIEIPDGIDFRG